MPPLTSTVPHISMPGGPPVPLALSQVPLVPCVALAPSVPFMPLAPVMPGPAAPAVSTLFFNVTPVQPLQYIA